VCFSDVLERENESTSFATSVKVDPMDGDVAIGYWCTP
jgi:hypothetical protein